MVFQKGRHIRRYSPHIAWAGRAAEYAGTGRAAVKTRRGLRALESCVSCLSHQTPVIFFNFRLTSLPCNDINAVSVMVLAWDCKELTETFTQSKRKGRGFAPRPAPLALVAELALRLRDVGLRILYPAREELRLHLLRLRVVQQSVELLPVCAATRASPRGTEYLRRRSRVRRRPLLQMRGSNCRSSLRAAFARRVMRCFKSFTIL